MEVVLVQQYSTHTHTINCDTMNLSSTTHIYTSASYCMITDPTDVHKSLYIHIMRVLNSLRQHLLQILPASLHSTRLYYPVLCKDYNATLRNNSFICLLRCNNVPVLLWVACNRYFCFRSHFTQYLRNSMTSLPRGIKSSHVVFPSFYSVSFVQLAWWG